VKACSIKYLDLSTITILLEGLNSEISSCLLLASPILFGRKAVSFPMQEKKRKKEIKSAIFINLMSRICNP
jgi:cytochrome c biogenesis protein CcdA